jgi:hypothetical protein
MHLTSSEEQVILSFEPKNMIRPVNMWHVPLCIKNYFKNTEIFLRGQVKPISHPYKRDIMAMYHYLLSKSNELGHFGL